jgi:hypothetical protein
MTALFREKHKALPFEEAVRKDSAVHVSLSSDSPVKQPGSLAAPTPRQSREADEARPPTPSRRSVPHESEELQGRAIAPIADGAPNDRGYMGDIRPLSTDKISKTQIAEFFAIAAFKPILTP